MGSAALAPALASSQVAMSSARKLLQSASGHIIVGGHRGMGMNFLRDPPCTSSSTPSSSGTSTSGSTGSSTVTPVAAPAPSSAATASVSIPAIGTPAPLLPRWRENSVPSFLAAARAGAEFVEYDVQVTSDDVPVIWHDDTLEFGDPASPQSAKIAELSAAEFAAIGRLSAIGAGGLLTAVRRFWHKPSRSQAVARWRCEEDGGFPTLEELFDVVPPEIGFDIEVKMATPDTLARTPTAEIDRMLGPILEVVNRACTLNPANNNRPLIFTSFDPDICSELRARVGTGWPVLFLTTGGMDKVPHADARRNSLAAAISFATANDLAGIVADTDAIAASPDSVAVAKGLGLSVATYGLRNDDPAWVLAQDRLGVHAAIVDDVAGVVEGLLAVRTATLNMGCCGEVVATAGSAEVAVQSLVPLGAEE